MTKTKFEVMAALNEVDVPCGPILSMKDIYEDKDRCTSAACWSRSTTRRAAATCRSASPIKLSDSPAEVKRSPLLGEHTDEVLGWLGYGEDDIKKLHEDGAV